MAGTVRRKGRVYKKKYKSPSWYKPKGYGQGHKANNNYKNGSSNYRARALARSGNKCGVCGKQKPASQLEIHHRDGEGTRRRSGNHKGGNLKTACKSCHRRFLQGRGRPQISLADVKKGRKKPK